MYAWCHAVDKKVVKIFMDLFFYFMCTIECRELFKSLGGSFARKEVGVTVKSVFHFDVKN